MNRRTVLVSATAVLSAGLAGCSSRPAGSSATSPSLPDGLSVETRRWNACVLKETPICGPGFQGSHDALLTDRESARNRLTDRAVSEFDADEFVAETDFSRSYLLLVQYRMQRAPRLRLDSIERTDAGLRVNVAVERPDGPYGDVSVPHTLAIRITDEQDPMPGTITVTIHEEGDRTDHTGTVTRSG